METRKFSKFEIARIKRTAQNLTQYLVKKERLAKKIEALQKEVEIVDKLIEVIDAPTVLLTGYKTEQLVIRADGKIDLRYPDTVVPPEESATPQPTDEDIDRLFDNDEVPFYEMGAMKPEEDTNK